MSDDKKTYELNLMTYVVELPGQESAIDYPVRENYAGWLRSPGMFKTGEDVAEAVVLAHKIKDCTEDSIVIDFKQLCLLKTAINRMLELTAEGRAALGGEVHEEAICRVFNLK